MKRKCLFLVIALVVVFGSVSVVSAYTSAVSMYTNRTSNTSARTSSDIHYSSVVDSCTGKVTLQEKYSGTWRTATGVPVKTITKTKTKTRSLIIPYTFTLVKGKVYRLKIVFSSVKGTSGLSKTYYSTVF